MDIKNGDVIFFEEDAYASHNFKKHLYLVMNVDYSTKIITAAKIVFVNDSDSMIKRNYIQVVDNNGIVRVNYTTENKIDYSKDFNKVCKYKKQLNNPLSIIEKIHIERENKSIMVNTINPAKHHRRKGKSKKQLKRKMAVSAYMPIGSSSYKQTRGMKDPTYKGYVREIRG